MFVARLIGLIAAIGVGVAVLLYLATGNRRWLQIAWTIFKFALAAVLAMLLLLTFERLIAVV